MIKLERSFLLMVIAVLILSAVSIPGSAITEQEVKDFFLNTYNPQIGSLGKIPGFTSLFGGQVMHIIINDKPGGTKQFELNAQTNPDGFITNIGSGAPDKPTLKLTTDSQTIESFKTAADPKQKIMDSIGSTIIIEGVDIVGAIKVTLMNVGLFFAKLFGLV
jgi:hypothetical protein